MVLAGSVIGTIQNIPEQDSWHPLARLRCLGFFSNVGGTNGFGGNQSC